MRPGAAMGEYRPGQRIELHPARDEWMQGDRYGEIVSVGLRGDEKGLAITVKLDKSGRRIRLAPEDIIDVF